MSRAAAVSAAVSAAVLPLQQHANVDSSGCLTLKPSVSPVHALPRASVPPRQALTHPDFEGKLSVVLAGYEHGPKNVYDMLRTNAGLSGRFTETLRLADMAPAACAELLGRELSREYKLRLSVAAATAAPGAFERLAALPGWANGRDVRALARKANQRHANRVAPQVERGDADDALLSTLCAEDLVEEARAMENERRARAAPAGGVGAGFDEPGGGKGPAFEAAGAQASAPPLAAVAAAPAAVEKAPQEPSPRCAAAGADEAGGQNEERQPAAEPPPIPALDDLANVLGPQAALEDVRRALEECAAGRPREELLLGVAEAGRAAAAERLREQAEAALRALHFEERRAAEAESRRLRAVREADELAKERERLRGEAERAAAESGERGRLEERAARVEEARKRRLAAASEEAEEESAQRKLKHAGVCVQGFRWVKREGGWRCAGGSHFVSDEQLAGMS